MLTVMKSSDSTKTAHAALNIKLSMHFDDCDVKHIDKWSHWDL